MTKLVEKIIKGGLSKSEDYISVQLFSSNCKHPSESDLLFYPSSVFNGISEPTVKQIVDAAMTGKVE